MAPMKWATKPTAPTRVFSALVFRIIWVTATAAMGWALAATAAIPFTVGAVILTVSRVSNRFGKISRLPYYGGPGYPHDGHSNYFEGIGPLVVNRDVIKVGENNDLSHVSDYGPFTGALPYPESLFAPYTAEAAGTGSSPGASSSEPSPLSHPGHG